MATIGNVLPRGRPLSDEVWHQRHLGLVSLLWLHAPVFFVYARYRGFSPIHSIEICGPIVVTGLVALIPRAGRQVRAASVALGLVLAASILVYLSNGAIEAHFHYFVVIAFLSLYQAWMPFLIAIVFVLFEHGIVGVLDPSAVYNHVGMQSMPGMSQDPWKWAFIHAGFLLAASFANLLAWRLTENEALHDGLTGLPNRTLFLDSVREADEGRGRAAVLFIDLDNFKDINDGFGHEVGDQLLSEIAGRLRAVSRPGDIVGRLGGDEFAVVLRDIHDYDEGAVVSRRYLDAFGRPFGDGAHRASASLGLVISPAESSSPPDLLRDADLAMYDAKRAGGAQLSCFRPEMHRDAIRRATFEAELRGALTRAEFVVYYQPLVGVRTGTVVGTEALVRWNHPTRGLIAPCEFIPAAERIGLIVSLGRWVLRTACAQTVAWQVAHPDERPMSVSVNLSPKQLADRHLLDIVVEALADSGLPPACLCLEITEGAVIRDFESALTTLLALKGMGVTLALDDFGTGYSSLSYLRQIPVDSLKIDRSFVNNLAITRDHQIVEAVVDLAHALGMSVTAEGVETDEQLASLRAMSTDVAQGYLLGRPMAAAELSRVLFEPAPVTRGR